MLDGATPAPLLLPLFRLIAHGELFWIFNVHETGLKLYPWIIVHPTSPWKHDIVIDSRTGESLKYRNLLKGHTKAIWGNLFANEISQLAQGLGTRITSVTNTIFSIPKEKVTSDRTVTYGRIVAEVGTQKTETHCTQLTVGGNLITSPGDVTTTTSDLITSKLLFNSVLIKKMSNLCAQT